MDQLLLILHGQT